MLHEERGIKKEGSAKNAPPPFSRSYDPPGSLHHVGSENGLSFPIQIPSRATLIYNLLISRVSPAHRPHTEP